MLHYPQTRSNLLEALSHTFSGLGEEGTGGRVGLGHFLSGQHCISFNRVQGCKKPLSEAWS